MSGDHRDDRQTTWPDVAVVVVSALLLLGLLYMCMMGGRR